MRIAVVGGGPGGLYFAALAKQLDPRHEITVWERNAADDTFGFGVVFSDETLGGIEHADQSIFASMEREFARWDDIDVHYRGQVLTSGGHGVRRDEPQAAAGDPAASAAPSSASTVRFRTLGAGRRRAARRPRPRRRLRRGELRRPHAATPSTFRPTLDVRRCKYMWLGTDKVFDAFKFYVRETPHGVMQIHGYPYDAHRQHVHHRDERRRVAAGRLRRLRRPRRSRPASRTRSRSRWCASCSPTCSTGTRC